MNLEGRVCSKCGLFQPMTRFSANRIKGKAYYSQCQACCRVRAKAWGLAHLAQQMLHRASVRAKTHGVPFDLVVEDIVIPPLCPVLGIPLVRGEGKPGPNSPTLDRFIPALGYVKGNVYVISHRANAIKNDGTPEEIMKVALWAREISSN